MYGEAENLSFLNWVDEGATSRIYPSLDEYFRRVSALAGFKEFLASQRFLKYPHSSRSAAHGAA